MDAVTLYHGDALDVLRGMADNSVDAVVTDPPYGLSDHDAGDVAEALACWLRGEEYVHGRGGFMGRSWDAFVPGPTLWREVYRVLKPGGHLLCFAGTRTQDLMGIAIRLAGFECRDTLQWLYGSGFPKSHDVGKAIDRAAGAEREVVGEWRPTGTARPVKGKKTHQAAITTSALDVDEREPLGTMLPLTAPATDAARQWDGWGTALKPAHEPILVFRKPLVGTVAANVQAWGTGALNIAASRVGTETRTYLARGAKNLVDQHSKADRPYHNGLPTRDEPEVTVAGRWPPNVVLSHAPGCERVGTRRVRGSRIDKPAEATPNSGYGGTLNGPRPARGIGDADGLETVDDWRCVDGCAARALTAQSGVRTSGGGRKKVNRAVNFAGGGWKAQDEWSEGDTGTAARFFPNFEPSPLDTLDAPLCALCGLPMETEHGIIYPEHNTEDIPCEPVRSAEKSLSRDGLRIVSAPAPVPPNGQPDSEDRKGVRSTPASSAASSSSTTRATIVDSAPDNAPTLPNAQTVQNVKSAASLCDSCATAIAQSLAAISRGDTPSPLGQASMPEHKRQILSQSLALFAESRDNTDTIPTIASLRLWFGYVQHAITACTTQESDDTLGAFARIPFKYQSKASRREREAGLEGMAEKQQGQRYGTVQDARPHTRDDYEYPRQPMRNSHPTVKPLNLCRWLCRLICQPGGIVLDPFTGSGTTGMAATMEGFNFVGIEQDAEYIEIARRRIAWAQEQQPPLLRATGD